LKLGTKSYKINSLQAISVVFQGSIFYEPVESGRWQNECQVMEADWPPI